MKRILIRSGKSPFHVATHDEVLQQDLIGTNSGNLLFSDAAHKLLTTPDTEVTSNGIKTDYSAERARQINETYDVFVVPLANAFRPSFEASLNRLSKLIEQLTIPVVVVGVGAQVGSDYDTDRLRPMESSARRFVKAVLDRSASIGVRGELTADYLRGLGFKDVDIIGCPSMFLHGPTFPELSTATPLTSASRLAINVSPDAASVGDIAGLARRAYARYPGSMYYAQNLTDGELLFWGDSSREAGRVSDLPKARSHPFLLDDRMRLPVDPITWMRELREYDFGFGTRIHGNIAALLAGTPSVVLCHDSRTLELCRYFDLPHRMLADLSADTDPADLYEEADFSALHSGHAERFERFTAFLSRNDLQNTYDHGDKGDAFDAKMAELTFPGSISAWDGHDDGALGYRIAWLREQVKQAKRGQASANKKVAELTRQNDELRELLAGLDKRQAATEKALKNMGRGVTGRLGPALKRRARKALGR
jgi:hypothetical protein